MSAPAATRSAVAAPQIACPGQWISRTATATVAGLAGIAGAISYSHMRVKRSGQAGQPLWLPPPAREGRFRCSHRTQLRAITGFAFARIAALPHVASFGP